MQPVRNYVDLRRAERMQCSANHRTGATQSTCATQSTGATQSTLLHCAAPTILPFPPAPTSLQTQQHSNTALTSRGPSTLRP